MKRLKYYALLMPLALGLASLAACSSDDDNEVRESGNVTSFDQVKFLQNNIIEIDSLGNIAQRVSGVRLNNADTTELTVGAADINAAKEMFESWLSPDTKTEAISPSTTDMKADLKDGDGNVKETVCFKAVTGDGDDIAEMTFDKGGVLKHFSKVKFVHPSVLNQNTSSPYAIGAKETHDTYEEGEQNWVCVREAKDGVAGLLVYISQKSGSWGTAYIGNFASPSLARAASEAMRTNNNWDSFVAFFKDAGQDRLNKGDYYWINDWHYYVFGGGVFAIRLSDGDVDWFEIVWKNPDMHFIQVRTFGIVD